VTITNGLRELDEPPLPAGRVRRPGAGRPRIEVSDPELADRLDSLVEPLSRGDPESPLQWTSKSTRALAAELTAEGHPVSHAVQVGPISSRSEVDCEELGRCRPPSSFLVRIAPRAER